MIRSVSPSINLELAIRYYQALNEATVRLWLFTREPGAWLYDPVQVMIEERYPSITCEAGLVTVTIKDGNQGVEEEVAIHHWHDRLLATVVNRASDPLKQWPGYDWDDEAEPCGSYVATVETLGGLLTPEPVSLVQKVALSVHSAFLRGLSRVRALLNRST